MINYTITPVNIPDEPDIANISCPNNGCMGSYPSPKHNLKAVCWSILTLVSGMEFSVGYSGDLRLVVNTNPKPWLSIPAAETIRRLAEVAKGLPAGSNLTEESIIDEFAGCTMDVAQSIVQMADRQSELNGLVNATTEEVETNIAAFPVLDEMEVRFDTHDDRQSVFPDLAIALITLSGLVVGLRFLARRATAEGVRSFDFLILFGWMITLAWGVVSVAPKPPCSWSLNHIFNSQKYFIAIDVLYPLALFTIKSSILLFYYRLTKWNYLRVPVVLTFIFALASTVFGIVMAILTYTRNFYFVDFSVSDNSSKSVPVRYKCAIAAVGLIIGTDVIIWLLPLPLLQKLTLTTREKVLAFLTFGLGSLACIASGLRLKYMLSFLEPTGVKKIDLFQTSVQVNVWTLVELNTAIICASLPALRALVSRYLPKLISSGTSSSVDVASTKRRTLKLWKVNTGATRYTVSTNKEQGSQAGDRRWSASPEPRAAS